MAISRTKKAEIVESLQERFNQTSSLVFVNFHGLPVARVTALRKQLKAAGLGMSVVKKTLLRRALAGTKVTGDLPDLSGEVAAVYLVGGVDPLSPAREIHRFAKPSETATPELLGGIYEGQYIDAVYAKQLAVIPAREQLYGQLVGVLSSPLRGLVITLKAVAERPARV